MKTFLCESPSEKSVILNLLHFRKMPKGHGVALIGFAIWRFSRVQFIKKKKKSMCTQLLGYAKNTCLAPGLEDIIFHKSLCCSELFLTAMLLLSLKEKYLKKSVLYTLSPK